MPLPAVTSDPAVKSGGRPEVRSRPPPHSTPYPRQPVHLHCGPRCFFTGRCPGAPWESSSQPLRDKTACPSHTHTAVNHACSHSCVFTQTVGPQRSVAEPSCSRLTRSHRCGSSLSASTTQKHSNRNERRSEVSSSGGGGVQGLAQGHFSRVDGFQTQSTVKRSEGGDF